MGALVRVLESSPAADVIDKDQLEIDVLRLHVGEQPLQPLAPADIEPAFALVGVGSDYLDIVSRGVVQNLVGLVLGRILLMLCRHAHILRRAAPKRQFVLHHDSFTDRASFHKTQRYRNFEIIIKRNMAREKK